MSLPETSDTAASRGSPLFRRQRIQDLQAEAASDHSLKRALGALNLTMLGIGAIIGTGIFVFTGTVAAQNAGPAVVLSFVLAGVASVFAALCYAEFASLVPMAGSAYTYGYATLGSSSPGSSGGTWCWSTRSAPSPWRSGGQATWCRS
jgi:amino acid transporter